jgi:hypothetical protein
MTGPSPRAERTAPSNMSPLPPATAHQPARALAERAAEQAFGFTWPERYTTHVVRLLRSHWQQAGHVLLSHKRSPARDVSGAPVLRSKRRGAALGTGTMHRLCMGMHTRTTIATSASTVPHTPTSDRGMSYSRACTVDWTQPPILPRPRHSSSSRKPPILLCHQIRRDHAKQPPNGESRAD